MSCVVLLILKSSVFSTSVVVKNRKRLVFLFQLAHTGRRHYRGYFRILTSHHNARTTNGCDGNNLNGFFLEIINHGKLPTHLPCFPMQQIHSARPYTVKVSSPDPLADDPDRWRRLFAQFGHVSYVTVCRGNGALLRSLVDRRMAGRKLEGSTANVSEVRDCAFVDRRTPPKHKNSGERKV